MPSLQFNRSSINGWVITLKKHLVSHLLTRVKVLNKRKEGALLPTRHIEVL